jgi:serine/threonine protein kinase
MNELSGYVFSSLREGDIALYRGSGNGLTPILLVAAEETSRGCVERLEHEYALKSELDADWAARPVALTHDNGRMTLVLEDSGGTPLDRLLARPLDVSHFLRIAIPLAGALRHVHERGLIHKDIKPANILVNGATGAVKFMGFGIASRLARERQAPERPETIAGTLAYMAPEPPSPGREAIGSSMIGFRKRPMRSFRRKVAPSFICRPSSILLQGGRRKPRPPMPRQIDRPIPKPPDFVV